MSLKTRLLFAVVLLVSLSVMVLAAYTTYVAVNSSTAALAASSESKMRQQGVQTKQAIKNYMTFNESQIRNFSSSSIIFNAANDFVPAFNRYTEQRGALTSAQKNTLFDYYKNDFATLYKKRNDVALSEPTRLVERLPTNSQALQYDFIAASQFPIGEKDKLTTLSNNSDYAKCMQSIMMKSGSSFRNLAITTFLLSNPAVARLFTVSIKNSILPLI